MGNKIRIYESEIKRAVRRKLMEEYIDTVDEAEQMTVYDQGEFGRNLDKLKGTYGIKNNEGKITTVTVSEEENEEKNEVEELIKELTKKFKRK